MTKRSALVVVFALVAACAREPAKPAGDGISHDQFVDVVLALALAEPAERSSVLQKHHVSAKQLEAYVIAHANEPQVLSLAFDSAQARLDRTRLNPR